MNFNNIVYALTLSLLTSVSAHSADYLSPNGYSGLGLVPGATTLRDGTAALTYEKIIPGARNIDGYNYQLGFGLYENLELVGRMATNDLKCNMFKPKTCPTNNIRDFSASMKWALPINWLKYNQASLALGFNDVGGAASYFKSYYVVGSKSFDNVEVTLGKAQAVGDNAMLRGTFGAIAWLPFSWSKLSLERVDGNGWAHAGITVPLSDTGANAWITLNRRLNDAQITQNPITQKQWVGFGVSFPLDRVEKAKQPESARTIRLVRNIKETDFLIQLKKNGFANPKLGKTSKGKAVIELESTSYQWNILDAAGVALGVIAGAYGSKEQEFDLVLTTRGIKQMLIRGDAACVKKWLESDEPCYQMQIKSLNSNNYVYTDVTWEENEYWYFRPELILSPTLVSTWATEYGAFDIDLGVHANVVVPLWQGAYWDYNHTYPVDVTTKNFEKGKPFYASRMQDVTSRRMLHQILSFPSYNTQARVSLGMAYNAWDGRQLETSTQTNDGRHRFSWLSGNFSNDTLRFNKEKSYDLLSYRYAYDDSQKTSTELTMGNFWGGDRGYLLGEKFWHGDTAITIYLKRSRAHDIGTFTPPLISFAGIQLSIPFTTRKSSGMDHFSFRGTNQWTYTIDTRVFDKSNPITFGYGEIPKTGDTLTQIFNRDRNSTQYYEDKLGRIKDAFVLLSHE